MDTENSHRLLTNEEIAEEDEVLNIIPEQGSVKIGLQLNVNKEDLYSNNINLRDRLTLRICNSTYGKFGGSEYKGSKPPEFDGCFTKGCISPLRRFTNIVGHFDSFTEAKETYYRTISLYPEILSSIEDLANSISTELESSMVKGRLWCLENCDMLQAIAPGKWVYKRKVLSSKISIALDVISISFPLPLSAHTQHAFYESQKAKNVMNAYQIFKQPEETTAVTGILGTLQNNQIIDLAQELPGQNINTQAREKDVDAYPGFLCNGHTAHSIEAGRVRRVCDKVHVRILTRNSLAKLVAVCKIANRYNNEKKEWIVFCMGKMTYCSTKALLKLRNGLMSFAAGVFYGATIHINSEFQTAIISISSGVLIKKDLNKVPITTMSLSSSQWPDGELIYNIPCKDKIVINNNENYLGKMADRFLKWNLSTFFELGPYISTDDPPRTTISSVQSIQGITPPFGAGTSSIAPVHISKPLVTTRLAEKIINSAEGFSDMMPGEDCVIMFAPFNETYEDSVMINADSIKRGLFFAEAYSAHVINSSEKVPEVGKHVHIKTHKWWKVYSNRQKEPPKETINLNGKIYSNPILAGGDGTGKIVSVSITQTGDKSVKAIRFTEPVTGDKFATYHGQKFVCKKIPAVDMPWGLDDQGNTIVPDLIMPLASITNRLTNGQYLEIVSGVDAARSGKRIVVSLSEFHNKHAETDLYDGITGQILRRVASDSERKVKEGMATSNGKDTEEDITEYVKASYGIGRVWSMSQLSWDKQHYTHSTASKYTISTSVGRTAGGGIRFGEMEGHAVDASGLIEPYNELKSRMDLIYIDICTTCKQSALFCMCKAEASYVKCSIPHAKLVFDNTNLLLNGYVTKYKVGF